MVKKTFDLNAIGRSALLKEQTQENNDEKKNKLIRGIPKLHLDAITALKKRGIYRLSANDFFLDAIAEKLERINKKKSR